MPELEAKICRRCDRPVRVSAEQYDVFEQMHYVCFHYEFEHDPRDPDEACRAGGCPSATGGMDARVLGQALNEVLNGPQAIEDWEFQTRLGVTREKARALLARLHAALLPLRPDDE